MMARILCVFVLVLSFAARWSHCMPMLNTTNNESSFNETKVGEKLLNGTKMNKTNVDEVEKVNATKEEKVNATNVEVKEEKEDGPSSILYPVCSGYLGISNRIVIKDHQMYASSTYQIKKLLKLTNDSLEETLKNSTQNITVGSSNQSNYTIKGNLTAAHDGRLGNQFGSWCASTGFFDGDHHLVVDLGDVKILEGVITQGRSDSDNWVTNYTVSHSIDKKTWHPVQKNGQAIVFKGNKDRNSIAVGSFPHRIATKFIKFTPKSYHGKLICMRVEAIGCHPDAVNVARDQPTMQSSTKYNFTSSKAVDGDFVQNFDNDTCTHTRHEHSPWLRIDLRRVYLVKEIIISNHAHRAGRNLHEFEVRVGRNSKNESNDNPMCTTELNTVAPGQIKTVVCRNGSFGRYVNIRIPREKSALALCEVVVIGVAETIVKLGLEDIANSLQTGSVTDEMGDAENLVGGLMGKLQGMMGAGMLNQLQGQGMGMLNNLKGQGMGMLNNLKGQGMGMLNNLKGQGLGMVNKLKGQSLEMANKMKEQGVEMGNKMKKQGMEIANKMKGKGMEMANKLKGQGMEMANKMKGEGMEMANKMKGQGMGMAKDMQKQMNKQQDKFKKKLKELLKKGKKYLKIGKDEMEKFKKKGYIETGKRYVDVGLGMTMDAVAYIQAKLMESMGSIAGDMTKQITTLSEYDTSDIKGLFDDIDPEPVRNFVEEARPKIADYIDEMQRLVNKYMAIGIKKGKEAKEEIESEAKSAADQATSMGKNMAGKAKSMGKKMANKAKAVGTGALNKAKSAGMGAMNKAKSAGMGALNKAKSAGMGALNKAKSAGMGALNKAKEAGMGALNKAKGAAMGSLGDLKKAGMGALGQAKELGMGALGQVKGLGTGMLGKLSGAGMKLLKKTKNMKPSQMKQMQQVQMLQQLKHMKKMKELQKKMEEEQDQQWKKFELLSKELEGNDENLKKNTEPRGT